MSSKGTRPVPTSLDSWAGVTDLVISYKFLLHVLWSSPSNIVNVIGVGCPGVIERLCSSSRLDEPVVLEALRELDRRGLVVLDEATREVAVRRWCAFHKFTGKWAAIASSAFDEIDSAKIKGVLVQREGVKGLFPTKTTAPPPNSNSNSNSNKEPSKRGAARPLSLDEGVVLKPKSAPKEKTLASGYTESGGITHEKGNERDIAALARIQAFPESEKQAAIQMAAAKDPHSRAFATAVLRGLLTGTSPGQSAAVRNVEMDEWMANACQYPATAAVTAVADDFQTVEGFFIEEISA